MDETTHVRSGLVGGMIRRRWRLLAVGVVVGLLMGFAAVTLQPAKYTSQASLYLNPLIGNPYAPATGTARSDQLVALQTEASLLSTPEVADLAKTSSTVTLPKDAETRVKGANPSNSTIVTVSFTAGTPAVATAGAQAFGDAYLLYRTQRAVEANTAEAAQVQATIDATNLLLTDASTKLAAATPGTADALSLSQLVQYYGTQVAQQKILLAQLSGSVPSPGSVISPASAPTSPAGLPALVLLVGAFLVAAGVATVLALAREHADNHIHDPDELTAIGAGHSLALLPARGAADPAAGSPEGYRRLHTILLGRHGDGCATVCVIGSAGAAVPDAVAIGLAATAARSGRRVLLVGPSLPSSWTTAHLLTEQAVCDATAWPDAPDGRHSDPAVFPLSANRADLVQSAQFDDFLALARGARDLIVLGGGSGLTANAWRMAESADSTLVAVELGHDTFDDVLDLIESLRESQITDVAVVAVQPGTARRSTRSRLTRRIIPGGPDGDSYGRRSDQ